MNFKIEDDLVMSTVNNKWQYFRRELLLYLSNDVKKWIQASKCTIQIGKMNGRFYRGLNVRFHFGTSFVAQMNGKSESFLNCYWSESEKLFTPIFTPSNNLQRSGRKIKEILKMLNKFGFKKISQLKKAMNDQENLSTLKVRRDVQKQEQEQENLPMLPLLFQATIKHAIIELCAKHGIEYRESIASMQEEESDLEKLKSENPVKWSLKFNSHSEKWDKKLRSLKSKFQNRVEDLKLKARVYKNPEMIEFAHKSNLREIDRDYAKKVSLMPILQGKIDLAQSSKQAKINHDKNDDNNPINESVLASSVKAAKEHSEQQKSKAKSKAKKGSKRA